MSAGARFFWSVDIFSFYKYLTSWPSADEVMFLCPFRSFSQGMMCRCWFKIWSSLSCLVIWPWCLWASTSWHRYRWRPSVGKRDLRNTLRGFLQIHYKYRLQLEDEPTSIWWPVWEVKVTATLNTFYAITQEFYTNVELDQFSWVGRARVPCTEALSSL